jgi:hypothetical protein
MHVMVWNDASEILYGNGTKKNPKKRGYFKSHLFTSFINSAQNNVVLKF